MLSEPSEVRCPCCGSQRIWKDGLRYTENGEIQRYICRECARRFSEDPSKNMPTPKPGMGPNPTSRKNGHLLGAYLQLNRHGFNQSMTNSTRQICATERKGAKNLSHQRSRQEQGKRGPTKLSDAKVKGKIFEFAWYLKKQGYKPATIRLRTDMLRKLVALGADLMQPESVKEAIAKYEGWSDGSKRVAAVSYGSFLAMHGLSWKPPRYRKRQTLPFIPLESELDALINGCGKKTGTFLQGLKDTGADPGELAAVGWTDINFQAKSVTLKPVKGHNPRVVPVSDTFLARLNLLRRTSKTQRIFNQKSLRATFYAQRKRLARKLANPRLNKITFRTFRHWKATMEYHKTKDVYHVKRLLGHKSLLSTEIYINLEQALFNEENDQFHVKTAQTPEEAKSLLEVGFEYVCKIDKLLLFRKRK